TTAGASSSGAGWRIATRDSRDIPACPSSNAPASSPVNRSKLGITRSPLTRANQTMTESLIALVTLTLLEIVLGVDNVIFISILSGKLPLHQQKRARRIGLMAAMGM